MDFADQLNAAMGDMTQEELELASGVDQSLISKYLTRKAQPNLATLNKLEKALPQLASLRMNQVA